MFDISITEGKKNNKSLRKAKFFGKEGMEGIVRKELSNDEIWVPEMTEKYVACFKKCETWVYVALCKYRICENLKS